MEVSIARRFASLVIVLCLIAASAAMVLIAIPAKGTVYQTPISHVDGNETMENLGRSIAMIDLNDDNIGDLVVGIPYASANGLKNAGAVTVYLSSAGVAMAKTIVINGTNAGELFGWCVVNAGDLNGDDMDDLAVGAPLADPGVLVDAGSVKIFNGWSGFNGSSNVTINGANGGEEFGYSIASAGDILMDNIDDLIVGAPFYGISPLAGSGRVYVFYGGNPMNSDPDKTFQGEVAQAHLGFAVAGGVNIDQDATYDMVAGAPGQGAAGAAYIVRNIDRANPTVSIVNGKAAGDMFGASVALILDLNRDTFGEVMVGAPYNDDSGSDSGSVSIMYGSSKFNTGIDITLLGSEGESFGWALASGDIKKDGYSDILIGAPDSRLNASSVGRVYAYYGGSPWTSPNLTLVPDAGASFFGGSLAVGENLTGDTAADFAVGDPLFNVPSHVNAGRVYVYAGFSLPPPPVPPKVKGHVYIPGTKIGLAGFTVGLESRLFNKSTTTNTAGYYEITAVPGTYWLNASRTGYVANSTYPYVLVMDDDKTYDFYPLRVPVVTGVVKDAVSSLVIRGATVAIYSGTNLVSTSTTPANGTFWMPLPDQYVPAEGASVSLTAKAWDQTHYTSTNAFSISRNETKWVNITLDRFSVVSGTVRDALDLSAVRGTVTANQGSTIIATTLTNVRGEYTIVAVNASAPGRLFFNVTAAGHYRNMSWVDVDKNKTYTLNFIVQRDNVKPVSELADLPQYSTTASVSLTATASDANGVAEVQLWYRKAGSASYTKYGGDDSSPYAFSFDSSTTGGDGTYEFYSIAVDWASNVENPPSVNDTWTRIDSQAPALAINSPTEGQLLTDSIVEATWTGSDAGSGIAKYEAQLDSTGWVDKGLSTSHSFTSVADGAHVVWVRATDNSGLTTTKSVNVVVDTTNAISAVDPLPAYTTAVELTVTVAAADTNGIQEVQLWYRYGGSGSYQYFSADTTSPYEFLLNTSNLQGDGMYEFYSRAIDEAGNNETPPAGSDTSTIVDNAAPLLSISSPADEAFVNVADVRVDWTGSDAASGISSFKVRVDGGTWIDRGTTMTATFSALPDGSHVVDVTASDNAGHNTLKSTHFVVDTAPPVVNILEPLEGSALANVAIDLQWTASDAGSGLAMMEVSKDGATWESLDVDATEFVFFEATGMPEGHYALSVRATDKGGLNATASVNIVLDRTAPSLTIVSPLEDEELEESDLTVTWDMLDSGSGIAQARISIDGGQFISLGVEESYDIEDIEDGDHNITIGVTDEAGNYRESSVSFTVSTGGDITAVMIGAIAAVVIAIIAVLLVKRRGKGAAPSEKKEPEKE